MLTIPIAARIGRLRVVSDEPHCPKCLYNRRGLAPDAPCPECGKVSAV